MMYLRTFLVLALVAVASAFAPVPKASGVKSLAMGEGYVPDGLSAAQWAAIQKKEANAAAANKKKFKNKRFETLDEWNIARTKANPNAPGAGHRFVKLKYDMEDESNFTRNTPRAADGM
mmetsp:Transcript_10696/g.32406  ORF Transcript_10696/g.32406 Transcript_10696/m.32406 type:complete len:119 (-) Transcript_10696:388-744(-)